MKLLIALLVALSIASIATAAEPSFADFDRRARAGEPLNVVFFGASLTWGANATDSQLTSYPGRDRAAIGSRISSGSIQILGCGHRRHRLATRRVSARARRVAAKPDLVFLDFSANDDINSGDTETLASYEAIVRRLVVDAHVPVVQVIFPFKWNVQNGKLDDMKRRTHIWRSAPPTELRWVTPSRWPSSGSPPDKPTSTSSGPTTGSIRATGVINCLPTPPGMHCDKAIQSETVCKAPDQMLYADTYLSSVRFRLSKLGTLPAGWSVGRPHVVAAYFDMVMSRWLDDEVVAAPPKDAAIGNGAIKVEPLTIRFVGTMVMLFGESTVKSVHYKATHRRRTDQAQVAGQPSRWWTNSTAVIWANG